MWGRCLRLFARGRPERLPVMLSREEVSAVLGQLTGTMKLFVLLLYGAGLRLSECLDLRVKDIDLDRRQIVVRQGKGQKDRVTPLPSSVRELLSQHLDAVRRLHHADLAHGFGRVVLPCALAIPVSGRPPVPRSSLRAAVAVSPPRVGRAEGGCRGVAARGSCQARELSHVPASCRLLDYADEGMAVVGERHPSPALTRSVRL